MNTPPAADPGRRNTIGRRRLLGAGFLSVIGLGLDAFGLEPGEVQLSHRTLTIPGLGRAFDGATLAQVSDVHFPGNHRAAAHALALLRRERPDIVVFTGDIVEHRDFLPELTTYVRQARGRLATVGIFGNWERKAGIRESELGAAYAAAGAVLLQDSRLVLREGSARLGLAGLGDALYQQPVLRGEVLDPGLSDADLWLVHCPAYAQRIPGNVPRLPAALLSGHTHGGQIRIPGWVPYTPIGSGPFVEGWYDSARAPLYVSRGVGTVLIEARYCCPPELPLFTIRPA